MDGKITINDNIHLPVHEAFNCWEIATSGDETYWYFDQYKNVNKSDNSKQNPKAKMLMIHVIICVGTLEDYEEVGSCNTCCRYFSSSSPAFKGVVNVDVSRVLAAYNKNPQDCMIFPMSSGIPDGGDTNPYGRLKPLIYIPDVRQRYRTIEIDGSETPTLNYGQTVTGLWRWSSLWCPVDDDGYPESHGAVTNMIGCGMHYFSSEVEKCKLIATDEYPLMGNANQGGGVQEIRGFYDSESVIWRKIN